MELTAAKGPVISTVICDISTSLDGYVTGPNDSRDNPFGDGAGGLHDWMTSDATPEDLEVLNAHVERIGAVVMGRVGFEKNEGDGGWGHGGPIGDVPCFVVTHHPPDRPVAPVFTFVTDGVAAALTRASEIADGAVVHLHGTNVMQQALPLGLVHEIHLHVVPVLLGGGTPLFADLPAAIGLERTDVTVTPAATHLTYCVIPTPDVQGATS